MESVDRHGSTSVCHLQRCSVDEFGEGNMDWCIHCYVRLPELLPQACRVPGFSERVEQRGFGHACELGVACHGFAPADVRA